MKIKVIFDNEIIEVELKNGSTLKDLFVKIGKISEVYIAKRNSEIIIESEKLEDGDVIELIKVVSGG